MYVFIFLIKVFKNHIVVLLNLANPDLKWVVLSCPSDLLIRFCIEKIKGTKWTNEKPFRELSLVSQNKYKNA